MDYNPKLLSFEIKVLVGDPSQSFLGEKQRGLTFATMQLDPINTIAIVGAGTMGSGIAQIAAQAEYNVILYDIQEDALKKGLERITKNLDGAIDRGKLNASEKESILNHIQLTSDFAELKAEVMVEAVIEKLDLKVDIFKKLAAQNPNDTILASNTSSIPITQLAANIPNPERVVGMHFFNPVHIMKLVEVISGKATDPEVAQAIKALAEKLGKQAVMAQDSPGFIVNRVARPFYTEGLQILEEQVADHETIDELIESSGFKMGPFRLMDLIGVDSNFYTTQSMYNAFHQEPRFRPSRIQEQLVHAGFHGRKTGKGFYNYTKD